MCLGTQNIQNNVHIYNEFVQNICTALHFTGVCERRTGNRWESDTEGTLRQNEPNFKLIRSVP
jgi:hypothetical protein